MLKTKLANYLHHVNVNINVSMLVQTTFLRLCFRCATNSAAITARRNFQMAPENIQR